MRRLIKKEGRYYVDDERDSVDISKEDWIALIDDPEVFNGKSLEVLGYFYEEEDHQASTKQITDKYGLASKNFNGVIIGLGKRARKVLGQRATVGPAIQPFRLVLLVSLLPWP